MKEEDRRPDSEQLLRSIQNADGPPGGRLKIFFGYAAGVGKTYAMLEAAHRAKEAGVDVVAGYIEPHTRPETMALLEGLEVLPTKTVTYKGISLKEFDLDGALARHPQLLLVDELAHTNAAGSRHTKRYQDIQELLRAGINVYTTVNVQHLESLNDVVASITLRTSILMLCTVRQIILTIYHKPVMKRQNFLKLIHVLSFAFAESLIKCILNRFFIHNIIAFFFFQIIFRYNDDTSKRFCSSDFTPIHNLKVK